MRSHRTYIFSLCVLLFGCEHPFEAGVFSDPYTGKILEKGTNKPIEGVVVLGLWEGLTGGIAANRYICMYSYTVVTNEKGVFHFPKIVRVLDGVSIWSTSSVHKPNIYIHKAGYIRDIYPSQTENVKYMVPDHSSFTERLKYFVSERENRICYDVEDAHAKYFDSMYKELKARATTEEEISKAEHIKSWAPSMQRSFSVPGDTPDNRMLY